MLISAWLEGSVIKKVRFSLAGKRRGQECFSMAKKGMPKKNKFLHG
jgi:hypothetical protein